MRRDMKLAISGTLATMGPAISFAAAGKFAFPDRPAIAFVGDGAMQMLGLNAMVTVAKYWKRWADPRFVVAVLNNRDLNMVTWELRGLGGAPKVAATQDLPDLDYAAYARMLGLGGVHRPTSRGDVDRVWEEKRFPPAGPRSSTSRPIPTSSRCRRMRASSRPRISSSRWRKGTRIAMRF